MYLKYLTRNLYDECYHEMYWCCMEQGTLLYLCKTFWIETYKYFYINMEIFEGIP